MPSGVLLVGLGQISMGYDLGSGSEEVISTHARAFARHPAFALCAGVDPDGARRDTFSQLYDAPAFADLSSALDAEDPEVVVIAVPTFLHGAILSEVLQRASPRVIICEKPLSYALEEARDMVRACEDKGCDFYVGYPRRSAPGSREVARRIRSGEISAPLKGIGWYSKGLLHNGSHFVNLLEYWLGPISGFSIIEAGRRWGDNDVEPDVRVTFASGDVSFFAAREENYSLHEIDLVASNGRLRYSRGGEEIIWQPAAADAYFEGYRVLASIGEKIATDTARVQWHLADQVAARLRGQHAELCTGVEALQCLNWLTKIRTSCE